MLSRFSRWGDADEIAQAHRSHVERQSWRQTGRHRADQRTGSGYFSPEDR